jgi:cysteine-S-conjugate beta-lyase
LVRQDRGIASPLPARRGQAELILERGQVTLASGPVFGTGGEGHVRLNFATSPAILEVAVRRMASAL